MHATASYCFIDVGNLKYICVMRPTYWKISLCIRQGGLRLPIVHSALVGMCDGGGERAMNWRNVLLDFRDAQMLRWTKLKSADKGSGVLVVL